MAGTAFPSLTAGQIARAVDVTNRTEWIEGSLVPMSGGSTTDSVHDLGTTTAYWRTIYTQSIAGTSTAKTVKFGTLTAATTTMNSDCSVEFAGIRAIALPRLSTAQLANVTSVDGMLAYNTTTSQLQVRKSGAWVNLGGTVYQAQARIAAVSNGGATVTALNVTGGGGRISGIFAWYQGAGSLRVEVQLDSITTMAWSQTVAGTGTALFDGAGIGYFHPNQLPTGTFAQPSWPGTASAAQTVAPGPSLNWDFASTATIYLSGGGAGSSTLYAVYSKIV